MSRRGVLLFGLMSVIWGIPYLFIRIAVAEIEPSVLVFVRTAHRGGDPAADRAHPLRPAADPRPVALGRGVRPGRDRHPLGHAGHGRTASLELAIGPAGGGRAARRGRHRHRQRRSRPIRPDGRGRPAGRTRGRAGDRRAPTSPPPTAQRCWRSGSSSSAMPLGPAILARRLAGPAVGGGHGPVADAERPHLPPHRRRPVAGGPALGERLRRHRHPWRRLHGPGVHPVRGADRRGGARCGRPSSRTSIPPWRRSWASSSSTRAFSPAMAVGFGLVILGSTLATRPDAAQPRRRPRSRCPPSAPSGRPAD